MSMFDYYFSEASLPPCAQQLLGLSFKITWTASAGTPSLTKASVKSLASCFFCSTVRPSHISTITTGMTFLPSIKNAKFKESNQTSI